MAGEEPEVSTDGSGGGTDRRSFVKGLVLGAAATAAGAAGYALWPHVPAGTEFRLGDKLPYYGAQVQGGPTEHGVPILPLSADDDGYVMSSVDDLLPYSYCRSRKEWSALRDVAGTDRWLRYHISETQLVHAEAQGQDPAKVWWYHDRLGDRVHVDDFADRAAKTGAGFSFRRRPEDAQPFAGVLVKYDEDALELPDDLVASWPDIALTRPRLVAYDAACTHLCCVAGWQESPLAEKRGAWDQIFCACHLATFDPFTVEQYDFRLVHDRSLQGSEEETVYKASTGRR